MVESSGEIATLKRLIL
ncbi:hypothetical protein GEMRC1_012987 [Eukaryota sp. GEM-RC1]